jgi:hypothetical protein
MVILLYVILAVLAFGLAWWLSGYDPHVTGENRWKDFLRRFLRILATVILLAVLFGLHPAGMAGGYGFVPFLMIIPVSIGLIWCGCISECWASGLHHFVFFGGKGEFDPHEGTRQLEQLASLLKAGRREEALQLAGQLMESGDASVLALEAILARADIEWKTASPHDPLAEVYRLHSQGNFAEVEKTLKLLVEKHPSHVHALLLLIRLYAQDLKQPDQAAEALRRLERVPHIPAWQVEYARRSLLDWGQEKPALPPPVPLPESIDELLAQGYSGTAIEILEQKIKEQPGDFDSWLKLAEAQGLYCHNLQAAEKIVRKIENNRLFTAEQVQLAKTKLAGWRVAAPQSK